MECFPDAECPCDFKGCTLVVGVPAVGNVGQLGIDLLTLRAAAKRCAILESPDVLPVAGRGALTERQGTQTDEGPKEGLVTALEAFRVEHQGVKCFFLQQRGPVVTGRQRAFAKELAAWIKASAFSEVVLLSSVEAGLRGDQQLQSTPVCAACQHSPAAESALVSVPAAPTGDLGDKSTEERCVAPWPLFNECGKQLMPTALLMAYAADGNNVPEAFLLANTVAPALPKGMIDTSTPGKDWKVPPSWRSHIEA